MLQNQAVASGMPANVAENLFSNPDTLMRMMDPATISAMQQMRQAAQQLQSAGIFPCDCTLISIIPEPREPFANPLF